MKKNFLSAIFALLCISVSAQYNYRDSNRIGIIGGINQFNLNTSDFETTPEIGWNIGLSMRGNFYNDFDMVYAIQFSENKFSVATISPLLKKEDTEFKLPSAQISLMLSYKIVENHLSIEFGPMIQINDKFNIDSESKENIVAGAPLKIDGTALTASDISKISRFNFYPVAGITAGVRHLRANIQYQYGVNNILGNLNDDGLGKKFQGHAGILCGNIIIYL